MSFPSKESKIEFEKYRELWKLEWYNYWRLLVIDFKTYMMMRGLTEQEYKILNNDELWKGIL